MRLTFKSFILFASLAFSLFPTGPASGQSYSWTPTSVSGGESNGVDTRYWAPGLQSGYFSFYYDFYNIPDSALISFGGQQVFSSGGYVAGSQNVNLSFGPSAPGSYPLLQVTINPLGPRPGTLWEYTLTPRSKPTLSSLYVDGDISMNEGAAKIYNAVARYSDGSSRVVAASWTSSGPIKTTSLGSSLQATAQAVSATTTGKINASYSEDGILKTASLSVLVYQKAITNNPDNEQKQDPAKDNGESSVGGPINTATGSESFYRPLIAISGARDFEFGLNYGSTFSGIGSPNGYGWSHPYAARFQESSGDVTIKWSPSHANTYYQVLDSKGSYYLCPDDDARFDILVKTSDGGFTLTKLDQTKYSFNPSGDLFEITNARGQKLNIAASSGNVNSITEPVSGVSLTFTYTGNRLTRVQDNAGRAVNFTYTNGLLTAISDLNGRSTTYTYNTQYKLATVTAADGQLIYTNTYDSQGRVISQNDGLSTNGLMTFTYSEAAGKLTTTVSDRVGAKTVYTHDAQYRLLTKKNPVGATTTYTYDAFGNRTSVKDALGRLTSMEYDAKGNLTRLTLPNGASTWMEYDARNNLTRVTNADGKSTTTTYDASNNPIKTVDFSGAETNRAFDAQGLLTSETSPRGFATTFTYTSGRLAARSNPAAEVTRFTYDAAGRVLTVADPLSNATAFTYSASGKVLTETHPGSSQTVYSYDLRDRLISARDPVNGTTSRAYDANNNILTITNAMGGVTSFQYDGEDRPTRTTDPRGGVTSNTYDAAGRLLSVSNPLGQVTKFTYDLAGNRLTVTDPAGAVTSTTYSPVDFPASIKDPLGRVSTLEYDLLGRLARSIDPLKRASSLTYDEMGRLRTTTNPLQFTVSSSYDAEGRRLQLTNAAGANTTFLYNNVGRQTSMKTPLNRTTSYTYDARGLPLTITEPSAQSGTLTYDARGNLTRRVDPTGTINYTYDAKNRLLTVVEGSKTLTRVYDALDRLTRFTDGDGNVIQYAYDANGNITTLTYPDGKVVTYTYDQANRMTSVTDWVARVTTYTYDAAGRLLTTTRPNGTKQTRAYDKAGQLASLKESTSANGTISSYILTYDAVGQVLSEVRTPTVASVVPNLFAMTYNADDQLTQFNGTSVTHDADGNMINGPIGSGFGAFTYDARNRLSSAGGLTYRYDAESRRVESQAGSTITKYINNPKNVRLWQVLAIKAGSAPTTYCVYGIGLIYTETNGAPLYHHYDMRGSTVATSLANGNVSFTAAYGPYGERKDISGTPPTPFLFVGQYGVMTDANSLCFSRARFYNPTTHRFINADPIGFEGGTNWYSYVGNNPLNLVDPWGLAPGDPYPTADAAGTQAVKDINPTSIKEGVEYAGRVYQNPDGTYSYTAPNKGDKDSSNAGKCPNGKKNEGDYHTHGSDDPGYDNENFSQVDIDGNKADGKPGYLGTPKGDVKKYDPATGKSTTIGAGKK